MSEPIYNAVLIAVIAALPGILATYVALRKNKQDAHSDLINDYREIIEPLKTRIRELESNERELRDSQVAQDKRIDCLEEKLENNNKEIERLRAGAELLVTQLRSIPMDPMWLP